MVDIIDNQRFLSLTIIVRLFCLCVVQSHFVPDEYWQSLEIAHRSVFGYGYITWEWDKAIRSYFYPMWFAIVYKLVEVVKVDYVEILIIIPRILQFIFSTVADFYLWNWLKSASIFNRKDRLYWVFLMWLMNLIVNYCSTRTLTNTAELNFTIIGMYFFQRRKDLSGNKPHFLWFVGLACLARPTAAIQWIPICVYDIITNVKPLIRCCITYIRIVLKILCLSVIVDYLFYKRIVLTPLNFILYNGRYNVGIHYGVHSGLWYFIIGIPIVLGPVFILFYSAAFRISKTLFQQALSTLGHHQHVQYSRLNNMEIILFITIMWTLCWYSFVPHKEFRFILPLVPAMLYLAGQEINFDKRKVITIRYYLVLFISITAIAVNIVGLIYLGLWHQTGPLTVISKLALVAKKDPINSNFLFLTPCHATPLYSHLHVNVTARFLTCEPNLTSEKFYKDESDIFFEDPLKWLNGYADGKDLCSLPSHIVIYDNLKLLLQPFFNRYNYTNHDVIFNSHFPQDRQSHYFEIYSLTKPYVCKSFS